MTSKIFTNKETEDSMSLKREINQTSRKRNQFREICINLHLNLNDTLLSLLRLFFVHLFGQKDGEVFLYALSSSETVFEAAPGQDE